MIDVLEDWKSSISEESIVFAKKYFEIRLDFFGLNS